MWSVGFWLSQCVVSSRRKCVRVDGEQAVGRRTPSAIFMLNAT